MLKISSDYAKTMPENFLKKLHQKSYYQDLSKNYAENYVKTVIMPDEC